MQHFETAKSVQQELAEIEELLSSLASDLHASLDHFFQVVDIKAIAALARNIKGTTGTLFFSGVGKSGIIARKMATTVSSTGTRALFLSPMDALHGDLGAVFPGDTVVMLSKSGETAELLSLLPALKNKEVQLVAVVSNEHSRLARAADTVIFLPLAKELCPFDLSPTTSTIEQLIFGDLLAMALMRSKKISLENYILNHPGGRIGRRHLLRVRDLMLTGTALPISSPNDLLMNTLVELSNKQCGCMVIVDEEQRLLGIFTDGDLRRAIQKFGIQAVEMKMADLMTLAPRTVAPDVLAHHAIHIMEADSKRPITVLVVVEEERVVGLLKMHDILQAGV